MTARNFSLRSNRANPNMRAYRTSKYSINQQYAKDQLSKRYGWWNHDTHVVTDSGIKYCPRYLEVFGSGDAITMDMAFTLSAPRSHRPLLTKSVIDADNSANDWMAATLRHEARNDRATRAYRDQIIAKVAAERAANAPTPKPRSERDIMLERVTTTGASGLGKARRKVRTEGGV